MQIILGGSLFPLKETMNENVANALSKVTVGYWVMDAMGSTIDLQKLNETSVTCVVQPNPLANGALEPTCSSTPIDMNMKHEHTEGYLMGLWIGLLVHCAVWFGLTTFLVARQKGE